MPDICTAVVHRPGAARLAGSVRVRAPRGWTASGWRPRVIAAPLGAWGYTMPMRLSGCRTRRCRSGWAHPRVPGDRVRLAGGRPPDRAAPAAGGAGAALPPCTSRTAARPTTRSPPPGRLATRTGSATWTATSGGAPGGAVAWTCAAAVWSLMDNSSGPRASISASASSMDFSPAPHPKASFGWYRT